MYVVFEGIDTCGKSTQISLLQNIYPNAVFTKEPGGSELGLKLREILLNGEMASKKAELFLFLADRAEHYEKVIAPNGERLIISDRGLVSGVAYGDSFDEGFLLGLNRFALNDFLPDKIVFLELQKEELVRRISQKEQDRIEKRGIEYMLRLQERMKNTLALLECDILKIDASKEISVIHEEIRTFIGQ